MDENMSTISIDFETRSTIDLRKTGVYPYAEHPTTDIWCMSYAIDDGPVYTWTPKKPDLYGLAQLHEALPTAELRAWNAGFEHIIYRDIMVPRYGFPEVLTEQWVDTAAEAAAMALPRSLGKAADVLNLGVDKDSEGYKLMMKMCRPRSIGAYWIGDNRTQWYGPFATKGDAVKKSKTVDGEVWKDNHTIVWWDQDPLMLKRLIDYCEQDVEVERKIASVIRQLPATERAVYLMNQRMNDRGIYVDTELVDAAADIMGEVLVDATAELGRITKGQVTKVTQVSNMKGWMATTHGFVTDNLRKDTVRDLLAGDDIPHPDIRRVLEIRRDAGKTSTAKLEAFQRCVADDSRAHGLLLYHGASTGRWAGALVQPQNFPRPELNAEPLIEMVRSRDYKGMQQQDTAPAVVIASMLRSMMMAAPGHVLMAADYSQIEARVLAWIAGQQDLVDLFASGGKIYETMAAFIFDMSVEDVAKDSFERQIGKNSVLGAGFQMGGDRFAEQVREQTGIILERDRTWGCPTCKTTRGKWDVDNVREFRCGSCASHPLLVVIQGPDDVAAQAIKAYRTLYYRIPEFWKAIEQAALSAVRNPGEVFTVGEGAEIRYTFRGQFLWCQLPSKRFLAYAKPSIVNRALPKPYEDITKDSLRYWAVDGLTKQWRRHYSYGGHLTENVVQAMARDLMAGAMLRVEQAGFAPVLTVHDEVVVEAPEDNADFTHFMELMQKLPRWATGLPVAAEGWTGLRYRK